MHRTIADMIPKMESYSIDEVFGDLTGLEDGDPVRLTALVQRIRARLRQWVGIPTCAGIAPSKTLAKLCDYYAKSYPAFDGVVNWLELAEERRRRAMSMTPVGKVWGIGPRTAEKLQNMGIKTVLDFADMDAGLVRRRFGVMLEPTHRELNGISCLALEGNQPVREQIVRTRSFCSACTQIEPIIAAVSVHMTEAVRMLRLQQCAAHTVGILFHTDPFCENLPQYGVFESTRLDAACADLMTLTTTALGLVRKFYKSGFAYKKAGVFLTKSGWRAGHFRPGRMKHASRAF